MSIKNRFMTLIMLICCAFAGDFLSVRLQGFFILAWGIKLPDWLIWFAAILITISAAAGYNMLAGFFKKYIVLKIPAIIAISSGALVFCVVFRNILIDEALLGSGIYLSKFAYWIMVLGATFLLFLFLSFLFSALKGFKATICGWIKTIRAQDIIFAVFILITINFLAWRYVENSSTVYFWDNAGYWQVSWMLADAARQGIIPLLTCVYHSIITLDYNYLIALPWTALVLLFGTSRLVFVEGIVNFGLFPLLLTVYFFIRSRCKRIIPAMLFVTCAFPMLFLTAFLGFIDIVGVLLALTAVLIWTADKNENDLRRFFLIGIFFTVSVLLRRWYSFFALSFVLALIIDCIIYRKSIAPVLGTLASFAFCLLFLFQPLVSNIMLRNYAQMYSAYKMGLSFDFQLFMKYFGALGIALVIISAIYACIKRETRQTGLFFFSQAVICFVIFTQVQSHGQQHLLLYVPSFICLSAMLVCPLIDAFDKRKFACTLLAATTLLPAISTAAPVLYPKHTGKAFSLPILPAFTFSPPVWDDADVPVRIVRYLDEAVGRQGKTLGVLASSFHMNYDILMNAEASLNLKRVSDVNRSYMIPLPAVDSRDAFPGELFNCDYFLVADPIQLHLGKEKQQVVYVPAAMLIDGTGIGAAFQKTGEQFTLDGGKMTVTLYKKIRPLTDDEKNEIINRVNANLN